MSGTTTKIAHPKNLVLILGQSRNFRALEINEDLS
jgi:hypothetical protein